MSDGLQLCSFDAQRSRLMFALAIRTQMELADRLGISQAAVSDAFKLKTIPSRWLLVLYERFHIEPEWVRSGKGKMFMPEYGIASKENKLNTEEEVRDFLKTVPLEILKEEIKRRDKSK